MNAIRRTRFKPHLEALEDRLAPAAPACGRAAGPAQQLHVATY